MVPALKPIYKERGQCRLPPEMTKTMTNTDKITKLYVQIQRQIQKQSTKKTKHVPYFRKGQVHINYDIISS